MGTKSPSKSKIAESANGEKSQKDQIQALIEHWDAKSKLIQKRISQNEVRLESIVSHSDYEYKDLLRESTESERDHKKDLRILIDLLCKYNIAVR